MIGALEKHILKVLLDKGKISPEELEQARGASEKSGQDIGEVLKVKGILTSEDVLSATCEVLNAVPIKASSLRIKEDVLSFVPEKIARSALVLPVSRIGKCLTVVMSDSTDIFALDDIKAITKMEVIPMLSTEEEMKQAVARYYEESADSMISQFLDEASGGDVETLEEEDEELSRQELRKITEQTPVVKLTNMILKSAIKDRASDILIEGMEEETRVRYRVDGVLCERYRPPRKYHQAVISRIKVMSELDIAERRLPQDGRFSMRIEGRRVDFRVSIVPSSFGEKAALRILDKQQATIDVDSLGFREADNKRLKTASRRPHGMILVCGPTGCGKTTTLYSLLKYVDSPEMNIITVEDPVEYELKGINQVSVRPSVGLTFASCLRSILRQDPDIIMVGEIRDYDTLDVAIKSALTGHLVLSTLHTNTAAGSITRMINMGVEPFLITSSVELVAAQRLLRMLCMDCREPYKPEEEVAEKYGLYDKTGKIPTIYRPVGCERCMNTGYRGRIGIIETLKVTETIKELVLGRAEVADIEKHARSEGMTSLRDNGIANVIEGATSLEDVLRTTVSNR